LVQAPTSFGKTMVAAAITNGALAKYNKTLVTVPQINLVDQTVNKFSQAGIPNIGVIQSDHPLTNPDAPVQVACTASLSRRKKLPQAKIVMIDEVHIFYKFYAKLMADPEWQDTIFIGWSATPWTKGLAKYFDCLIIASTLKEMIQEGLASDFDAFAPKSKIKPDLSGVDLSVSPQTGELDYNTQQLSKIRRDPVLIGDCVKDWFERAQGEPTMLFAVDREHARDLRTAFEKAGVKTEYMDKDTSRNERPKIIQRMENRESTILAQVATCVYGVDLPFLSCISWNCDTKSEMKFVQGFGRGVRLDPHNPAKRLIFIDHSQTVADLGLPTNIYHSELCDGTKRSAAVRKKEREERQERPPWECCMCGRFNEGNTLRCSDPACGYWRGRVQYAPGELAVVHGKSKEQVDANQKQLWYSQLLWMQDERGYADKWAFANFCNKFKTAPKGLSSIRTPAGQEVLNWVKGRLIRRAYSRYNPQRRVAV